jgi:hypothetical protein
MNPDDPDNKHILQITTVLWAVFLASPLFFLLVTFVVLSSSEGTTNSLSFSDPLVLLLSFIGLIVFVLGLRIDQLLARSRPTTPGGPAVDPSGKLRVERILPVFLIRLALFESVAMLGLVLALLKSSVIPLFPFLLLALAGLMLSKPSYEMLRRLTGNNQ